MIARHIQTADELFSHCITFLNRTDRIAKIASIDLDNPEMRLALQLAIKAHRLLNSRTNEQVEVLLRSRPSAWCVSLCADFHLSAGRSSTCCRLACSARQRQSRRI